MTLVHLAFIIAAVIVLGGAVMVVSSEKLLHSALWLIVSLFGVAILFVLLQAEFFAVAQVVIYIGAIAILIIFAVMLTRRVMQDDTPQLTAWWGIGALAAVALYAMLVLILRNWNGFYTVLPEFGGDGQAFISQLGIALSSPDAYVLPFEVASVLLLAALVGSIYIAFEKR
jgi:NADH-quinone oxidoreductase subunit J